jgi:transcriptional regulator with XRE-family HTH domain
MANRLLELRESQGMDIPEFIHGIRISGQLYGYYERGDRPAPVSVIEAIAERYNVNPAWLAGWSDDERPVIERVKVIGGEKVIARLEKQIEDLKEQVKSAHWSSELYAMCGTASWRA